jgi:hypothetical protein
LIPEPIRQRLLEHCRRKGGVKVDIHHEGNPHPLCGLPFDIDGKAKVLSGNMDIIWYISMHMKYARFPIMIKIDGEDLQDVTTLKELPPPSLPEEINIDLVK